PTLSTAPLPPTRTLFPYTTLFRSQPVPLQLPGPIDSDGITVRNQVAREFLVADELFDQLEQALLDLVHCDPGQQAGQRIIMNQIDRKSTRLNSSHRTISYAVFCLK